LGELKREAGNKRTERWRESSLLVFQKLDGGSAQYVACGAAMFFGIAVRDAVFRANFSRMAHCSA
jgi:hypothetical protein